MRVLPLASGGGVADKSATKMTSELNKEVLSKAATVARGLAIDAVHACQSGHLGLPLGCAEIGAVLYGNALVHCPKHPEWLNRDRFVLSAGHGSMFLYSWLHLSGLRAVPARPSEKIPRARLDDARASRADAQAGRVETTSGPLGQGVANSVGMAVAAKMAEARFNTPSTASSTTTSFASRATAVCKKAWRSRPWNLRGTNSSTT